MGKCLSCCQVNQSSDAVNQQPKYSSARKVGTATGASGGSFSDVANNGTLTGVVEGQPVFGSSDAHVNHSKGALGLSEKFMFYPKIPPIRSGSGDKRSSHFSCSESKIIALYEVYKDPHEDAILSDGIETLCQDIGVKPEEFKVLVFAWKLSAEQMCRFTRQEFVEGFKAMKVDSIQGIQAKLPELLVDVQDSEQFKDLYRFTYKFGLEAGQRILPTEMAIQLWKLVFSQKEPPILCKWLMFLEKHPHIRGVPRDTWNMFLNFCEAVGHDLSTYDDTEAWPSLFDDFVEFENDQTNQNIYPSKDMQQ